MCKKLFHICCCCLFEWKNKYKQFKWFDDAQFFLSKSIKHLVLNIFCVSNLIKSGTIVDRKKESFQIWHFVSARDIFTLDPNVKFTFFGWLWPNSRLHLETNFCKFLVVTSVNSRQKNIGEWKKSDSQQVLQRCILITICNVCASYNLPQLSRMRELNKSCDNGILFTLQRDYNYSIWRDLMNELF